MPELPEVETIRRQLDQELKGYSFVSVKTNWKKSFRPSFDIVSKAIAGKKIKTVDRQAKLLIFNLSGGSSLLFHLKLTGQLLIRNPSDPLDNYTRSVFSLKLQPPQGETFLDTDRPGSKELRFADARKFGFVKLVKDKKEMEGLLEGYGPEPLKDLTLKKFLAILKDSSRPVKIVLLDQTKISGIGNIYANDALWLAKVSPRMASNKITKELSKKLYDSILIVLKRGLKYGGASDQWYVQTHGEKGKYQEHFLVYGRTGDPCDHCGLEIRRIEVGGRGTFFCSSCQK